MATAQWLELLHRPRALDQCGVRHWVSDNEWADRAGIWRTGSHVRELAIVVIGSEHHLEPTFVGLRTWFALLSLHGSHSIRRSEPGMMVGGFALTGPREDSHVRYRSVVQVEVSHAGSRTDVEDALYGIASLEWFATSTFGHSPARGTVNCLVTLLPDRDIKPSEYPFVLESLSDRLNGSLTRAPGELSKAFLLPACRPENAPNAFLIYNHGSALPVDDFVSRGRGLRASPNGGKPSATLSPPAIARSHSRFPVNAINVRNIHDLLRALPISFAEQYDLWLRVGFAIHDFDAGDIGLSLFRAFSRRCQSKAAATDFSSVWGSFGRPIGSNRVSLGSLIYHARKAGWREPQSWDHAMELLR